MNIASYQYRRATVQELVGISVLDLNGQELGQISDIILDKLEGKILEVVYVTNDKKSSAIAWNVLNFDVEENVFFKRCNNLHLLNRK